MRAVGGGENRYNVGIAAALVQIARDWVGVDAKSVADLKRVARHLPGEWFGRMTEKNKNLLRQFDDPAILKRLLALPERMWRAAMSEPKPTFRTLSIAQAAIAIAILTYMPIRLQNLTKLCFDIHLFLLTY